jgi:hypothetical protein
MPCQDTLVFRQPTNMIEANGLVEPPTPAPSPPLQRMSLKELRLNPPQALSCNGHTVLPIEVTCDSGAACHLNSQNMKPGAKRGTRETSSRQMNIIAMMIVLHDGKLRCKTALSAAQPLAAVSLHLSEVRTSGATSELCKV